MVYDATDFDLFRANFSMKITLKKSSKTFLSQWFSTWGLFAFFLGARELLIIIFIISSLFYISYMESFLP